MVVGKQGLSRRGQVQRRYRRSGRQCSQCGTPHPGSHCPQCGDVEAHPVVAAVVVIAAELDQSCVGADCPHTLLEHLGTPEARVLLAESSDLMADDPAVRPLLREVLLENLRALLKQKQGHLERLGIVPEGSTQVGDIADEAEALISACRDAAISNLLLESWRDTRDALKRVQRDGWGFCRICGTPLSAARLMACPQTDRCVDC